MEAGMGQVSLSDLPPGASLDLWSLAVGASLSKPLGLGAELRVDAPALKQPGTSFSMKLDPGSADYGLTLKLAPLFTPVGLEYHRMAGNLVSTRSLASSLGEDQYLLEGEAAQLFNLAQKGMYHRLRVGYGRMGVDTNLAPVLLGLHGFLPSHRSALGPFATMTAERLRLFGFVGRAGLMVMLDTRAHRQTRGDYLAWGATMHRALGSRLILGASYMGGNSSLPGSHPPSMMSLYFRMRWGSSPR